VILLLTVGCSRPTASSKTPTIPKAEAPKKALARVSSRPGNREGSVFIVEYHKLAKEEARWDRSIDRFKADLQRYYDMGFRPVTLSSYVNDAMELAPGASPIVFTFDDSHPSQFRFLDDGSIDPDCAVGIWQEFAKTHPDFPVRATFYILPDSGPWGQPKRAERKFKMLKGWGCEIGSHTMTHRRLSSLSDSDVKKELAGAIDFITAQGFACESVALPYGISPKNKSLLAGFTLGGKAYGHKSALLVGANPAPSPESPKRNLMRLPRIQSIEGDYGVTYWLDRVASGREPVYVEP